jgi:hypothetical protein
MRSQKFFWGTRYLGGNRTCTTGEPNPKTGRLSRATEPIAFCSKKELDAWLIKERLSAPAGCGGGERVRTTLERVKREALGLSAESRDDYIRYLKLEALQRTEEND